MRHLTSALSSDFVPVILAGGSGTRFWPRSRRSRAKQVLALDGDRTMIQQTIDRLSGVASAERMWVITNQCVSGEIRQQLPEIRESQLVCEPVARNTAPACGLAAFLLERTEPDSILGIFPSDHVVRDTERFTATLCAGIAIAQSGENIVVLGVPPSRPETGYGYIEQGRPMTFYNGDAAVPAYMVRRFTEKPDLATAENFLSTGRYSWNSGIFLWSARTLCNALREHAPAMAATLQAIADAYGTPDFQQIFELLYPTLDNISIDYAILEPRSSRGEGASGVYCLPADFGWNDLGSWSALHEHRCTTAALSCDAQANVVEAPDSTAIDASGNYIYSPGKYTALVGVHNLVVVVTEDAILVTTRDRAQDVGQVVRTLHRSGHQQLT